MAPNLVNVLFFSTETSSVWVFPDGKIGSLIQCSIACLALNEIVILKVAGSYCLKCARFVQGQIKVLLCMPACDFVISWLHLC